MMATISELDQNEKPIIVVHHDESTFMPIPIKVGIGAMITTQS